MGSFVDIASSILFQSERRTEISAQNIANLSTAGYKRRIPFAQLIDPLNSPGDRSDAQSFVTDYAAGKPIGTDNPLDFSLSGPGFFVVQGPDGPVYTRQGQFTRDGDGRLVTLQGLPVLAQGGGDIVIKAQTFTVAQDGTVLENGQPTSRLEVIDFIDRKAVARTENGQFTTPPSNAVEVDAPVIRQGALESSNVSTGDEMVSIMESLRRAEAAQRLINVYDDLMGRTFQVLGES